MDFFTQEKTPQHNFSSQNFSVENNYFLLLFHSSQSLMLPMQTGDRFSCLLHEGALRGGPGSHPFTTLIGYKVADDNRNKHNEL